MHKVKKLKQRFKKEADKQNKSGNGRGKQWKFFTNLDEIIGHRPNVCPEYCIDTSASVEKEKTEEDEEEGSRGGHFCFCDK
jgi:hypothetical protein